MRTKASKKMPKAQKEWPRTVEEAVDKLLSLMSEEEKQSLKNAPEKDLVMFHFGLGTYIRNEFGLWQGNTELLKSCDKESYFVDPDDALINVKHFFSPYCLMIKSYHKRIVASTKILP